MKACMVCEQMKFPGEFYAGRGMADGRENICKQCKRARRKAHYTRQMADARLRGLQALENERRPFAKESAEEPSRAQRQREILERYPLLRG